MGSVGAETESAKILLKAYNLLLFATVYSRTQV